MGSNIQLPALDIRPPQQPNPVEQMGQLVSLRNLLQSAPLQQQILQEKLKGEQLGNQVTQNQIAQTQAINQGYKDAFSVDENGSPKLDTQKLTQSLANAGHGSAVPDILKHYNDFATSQVKLQKDQQDLAVANQDSLGSLGAALKAAKYDPNLGLTLIQDRLNQPNLPPQVKQALTGFQQKLSSADPQAAYGMVQQVADNWIAQSPKQRELAASEMQAQARMKQASKPQEGELVLGDDRIGQLNQLLTQRYQVLNPGQAPPAAMQLQSGATQKDFDRVDKMLEGTERAKASMAQMQTVNAIRQQTSQLAATNQQTTRSDKSYQFNVNQLENVAKPIDQAIARMSRLQDTLAQNTPQGDALVAPELLTVMAGGAGSGLRMNEAEIQRVVGGRSNWEGLQAAINKWSLDPSTANSITPSQRQQIRALVQEVNTKLTQKQQTIDDARQQLLSTDDPNEHRKIVANARSAMTKVDQGQQTQAFKVPAGAPPAPAEDGHKLKMNNQVIAISKGGQWVQPQ